MGSFSGVIGAIVATFIINALLRRAKREPRVKGNRRIIEYGRSFKVMGIGILLAALLIAYAASQASSDQRTIAWCVTSPMLLFALYMLLEAFFVRIEIDEQFIYTFSPWRRFRKIPIEEVIGYSFSKINQILSLKTTSSGTVRLSTMLSGLIAVRDVLLRKKFISLPSTNSNTQSRD